MNTVWLLLSMLGCSGKSTPAPAPSTSASTGPAAVEDALQSETTRGIDAPQLAALADRYWTAKMDRYPTWADALGLDGYATQVTDLSPEAGEAWKALLEQLRDHVRALDGLTGDDIVNARLLEASITADLLELSCDFEAWQFSARDNPMVHAQGNAEDVEVDGPEDVEHWTTRLAGFTAQIDQDLANRRRGLADGRAPTAASVQLVLEQVRPVVDASPEALPLYGPAEKMPEDWDAATREKLGNALREGVMAYQQALGRWADAIEAEVLPAARSEEQPPGLVALPGGPACYQAMIEHHTSLPLTADEVHQTGLDEIARLHREVSMLGKKHSDRSDVAAIFEWLRTDPGLYFETEDQIEAKANEALDRARAAIPEWFGILPKTGCDVACIPEYLAPYTTIAYYEPLAVGERDGTYFVNTYAPQTRPRHEAEVLAFHESIPGHHLQIAIAQERAELPAFRRHMGTTAFVEGWALYSEQLSDEMGLYSGDTDRFGMYSFELWRAARLVVDTGIHAKGWSRQQAIDYMLENTPLAKNNIENEVDRYINTPGQALAYKTGQLEIWALRRRAEAELGEAFDIKGFHDIVLGAGAVTLPVLRERVEAWIHTTKGASE